MATISKRIYIPLSAPKWGPTPCYCRGQVSLKIEETIAKLVRGSIFCLRNVILSFCTYPSLGSKPLSYDRVFGLLVSPIPSSPRMLQGSDRGVSSSLWSLSLKHFFDKTKGLSRATFFHNGCMNYKATMTNSTKTKNNVSKTKNTFSYQFRYRLLDL